MSQSKIQSVPYEIASHIVQELPVEDVVGSGVIESTFPGLDTESLRRDRLNPIHIFRDLTQDVRGLLKVMLVSGTVLVGSRATRYFQPSYGREQLDWHFVLCDNFVYAAVFLEWMEGNGFTPDTRKGKVATKYMSGKTISGSMDYMGKTNLVHVTVSTEMYGLVHTLKFASTAEQCCITGFGAFSFHSSLTRDNKFSMTREPFDGSSRDIILKSEEDSVECGAEYVPWECAHSSVKDTQHYNGRFRHVGDSNCATVPFYDMGVYDVPYAESAKSMFQETRHVSWWEKSGGTPFDVDCKYIRVAYRGRPGSEWGSVDPCRYAHMKEATPIFCDIVSFVYEHGGIKIQSGTQPEGMHPRSLELTVWSSPVVSSDVTLVPCSVFMTGIPSYSDVLYDSVAFDHESDISTMMLYGIHELELHSVLRSMVKASSCFDGRRIKSVTVRR